MTAVGIDVGKAALVVAVDGVSGVLRFANTAAGIRKLLKRLEGLADPRVVVEATGGQPRSAWLGHGPAIAHQGLQEANVRFGSAADVDRNQAVARGMLAESGRQLDGGFSTLPMSLNTLCSGATSPHDKSEEVKSVPPNRLELEPAVLESITEFCAAGDRLAENGAYVDAIRDYNRAWQLVPEPKNDWEASTWILAASADAAFLAGYKTSALESLEYAMTCPGAVGNPFLHLRFGQVLFDKDRLDEAADQLMRAFMGGGDEIFQNEDPRYLAFLRTRATIP
jgi:hypothetical protein